MSIMTTHVMSAKLKRVHVNQHTIRRNTKEGTNDPVIGVEVSGEVKRYGHAVNILGPSRVIHWQEKPLSCGAKCWIETKAPVTIEEIT